MLRFSYCLFVGYWESVLTVVSTYNWVKCSPVTIKVSYVVLNLTGDFFFFLQMEKNAYGNVLC